MRWRNRHDFRLAEFRGLISVKFYRSPGMPHGAGGPSYDDFDFFSPLVDWVEKGVTPQSVRPALPKRTPKRNR
ncbi:tannase/feruloyl esterase family alpha/beta hydrolase [Neorhizobium sp. 2083]|uniref:tannase/feruloyl esterase family alpha/beta hydrolase n=1 Tax=Neorhizobium sp. 2083 TaxID=2817762 RepID=UPI00286D4205|nr:tannase/feruloyl esterase family alpha/beta hydrolase [Neorhizobium sp. 2083]